MSSRNIEREIVQAEFDGRKFVSGVQSSMQSLNDFKKSFDMTQPQKSLADIDKAANSMDFSGMQQGIGNITTQFSAMGIVAFTVINRLTNAVIDFAKNTASALFVDPAKTGLEEYETQLNAIQTILANTQTKGTTLDDVNAALDELNKYSDQTIYNFTQMTSAIGRFTTAGIDLDTSVGAIKGLSNVAAVSGANAEEASRAYYQLSQALSSGIIRLQDWMSIENSNMGGQAFRDSLLETARVHGVKVDEMIEKNGSFRLSLQEQWLTSEIMLETLSKFTGELSDEALAQMGYTEEQIVGIQQLAQTSLDAATKIKTATQLIGVMKEALQSGWGQTWRIIFGDFEEAKQLWGTVAEILGDEIEKVSNRRNAVLRYWDYLGGRSSVINGVLNLMRAAINIIHVFMDAIGDIFKPLKATRLNEISQAFFVFSLKIKMASENAETFKRIVRGFAAVLDIAIRIILAIVKPIAELISKIAAGSGAFWEWVASIADAIVSFRAMAIHTDLFNKTVEKVIAFLGDLVVRIRLAVDSFMELEVIQDITKWIRELGKDDFLKFWDGLLVVIRAIITPFYLLGLAIKELLQRFLALEVVQKVINYFKELDLSWKNIKETAKELVESIKEFFNSIKESEILEKFVTLVKTFDGRRLTAFLDEAKDRFGFLGDVIDAIREKLRGVGGDIAGAGSGLDFSSIGQTLKDGIVKALDWLIENAQNIDYSAIFDAINTGLLAGVVLSIRKLASGSWLGDALGQAFGEGSPMGGIKKSITETLGGLQSVITAYQTNIKADTLLKVAGAIGIFAGSLFLLTLLDTTKLQTAGMVVAAMLATLFGSSAVMTQINTKDIAKTSVAIIALSTSLAIASLALSKVSNLDGEQIKNSLAAMGIGLVGLVLSVNTISAGAGTAKNIAILLSLGLALNILAGVIKQFGEMDPAELSQGLLAIGASLALLSGSLILISEIGDGSVLRSALAITDLAIAMNILATAIEGIGKLETEVLSQGLTTIGIALAGFAAFSRIVKPAGMISASVAILIVSASLLVLAQAIKAIGDMDQEVLIQGLLGMGAALLILAIAANVMTGALAGAVAILIMSVALTALAVALKIMGSMSIEELLIALAAMAGVFIILGLAGLILAPLVPVLLLLGAAMLLIGIAAGLLGLGIFLAATGLVALAASGAAIAGAIGVIGVAIIELLPRLGQAIADALVNFLTTIAEKTPELIEAFKTIVLGMIQGITELIPEIVVAILAMITALLQAIGEALPDIIQAGYDILLAILQGIGDNIAEVVEAGLRVLTEFLNGIAEGLPDLVDSGFNLILTFLESIEAAVTEYLPRIIEAGIGIGVAIIEGVAQAITNGSQAIKDAVWALVRAALDALNLGFLVDSPSKATYEVGEYVVQGLVNAISDGITAVRNTIKDLTKATEKELNPMQKALAESVDNEWEFNPLIRPILDLDNIKANKNIIGSGIFNVSASRIEPPKESALSQPTTQGNESGVTFIQNNYSPKALDANTIYRQTRTQVARLSTRAFEK